MKTTANSYDGVAKFLHWLTACIWLPVWGAGALAVYFRDSLNPAHGLTYWHKAFASFLIALVVVRIVWRISHKPPPMPTQTTDLMRSVASLGHLGLYLVALLALPLSGWIWSSVADKPIMLLGVIQLPPLLAPNPQAYDLAKWAHVIAAWTSAVLILGHVAMALKHHWIDKDHVLLGMLPSVRKHKP